MKLEKVYLVEFMSYTNCLNNTVSTYDPNLLSSYDEQSKDMKYLSVPSPFLVTESKLSTYSVYGQGFRSITYVGSMYIEED